MVRRGHQVSVATSMRIFDKLVLESEIEVFRIRPILGIYSLGYYFAFPFSRILEIVRRGNVDIVHALQDYSANSATAAIVSWVTNVPFVYTIQGIGVKTGNLTADILLGFYDRTVEHLITRRASRVILLSKHLLTRAVQLGVNERKATVVPSGVDYSIFDPRRPEVTRKRDILREEFGIKEDIIIGYVGRLIPSKGIEYLVRAVYEISDKARRVTLLVVGDGPYKKDLDIISRDLGLRTIFAGWQAETAPYYALMDIFALPSPFEGLPNAVLEAMAMEKPIVATDIGGIPDLVEDGENGFLVPAFDHKRMASALLDLVRDGDLRARMGHIGREKIKKSFSWDAIAPRVEQVYRDII